MSGRGLTITTAVLGAVGLALLTFETVQAMRSVVLGTLGIVLLYVGLGLTAVAATLVVISLTTRPSPDPSASPAAAPAAPELADESTS
jgi:hypothetical protein